MFVGVWAVRLGIPVHGVSHFSYKIIQLQTGHVASKILRNMLGSNNLVVDLPNSTETMLELEETSSSSVPPSLISSKKYITDDQDKHKYKLSPKQ